jgi:carboxyl-terminal processing protease
MAIHLEHVLAVMKSALNRRRCATMLFLLLALAGMPAFAETQGLSCEAVPGLLGRFFEMHVAWHQPSPELDKRFTDLLLRRVDPGKVLLTKSEAEAFRAKALGVLNDLRAGKCDSLASLKDEQLRWHKDMEAYVRKTVAPKDLQIDKNITVNVDPDKQERPATPADRDELRRRLVQFQLANYMASGSTLDDAKQKLVHRYELNVKRVSELKDDDVKTTVLDTFANAMDPHSGYLSASDLENFRISMDLSLEGIGAVLRSENGYTIVEKVVPGGPADHEGELKAEDRIIAVGQETGDMTNVIDMDLNDVVQLIRGKKGTKVRLTVLRQGAETRNFNIALTRDEIDLKEQAAKLTWQKVERNGKTLNLAILDLPSFYGGREKNARQATDDVAALLKEVAEKKADGLVLDMSANSGGLLSAAVDIAGYFIHSGAVVGIDAAQGPMKVLADTDDHTQYHGPMVVLISRASASAAEIVAGALKDYHRAVIVGDDHTFGKGTVQNMVDLPPGWGALKVTMAVFFRPGGYSTQSRGVESDISVPSVFNRDAIGENQQPYALEPRQVAPFLSPSANVPDNNEHWQPISADRVKVLAARSSARQAKSKEFADVRTDLEKAKRNDGVVKISELLADTKKAEEKDKARKDPEEEMKPERDEAVEILADLVSGVGDTTAAR